MMPSDFVPGRASVFVFALIVLLSLNRSYAQKPEPPGSDKLRLTNDMIEWKGVSFGCAGPVLTGKPAQAAFDRGLDNVADLLHHLDDADSFVVAHVLLTKMWNIKEEEKEIISTTTSTGYMLSYNGLNVRIDWRDKSGTIVKDVTIFDTECQRKRLRDWWAERYRNNPSEFSSKTSLK